MKNKIYSQTLAAKISLSLILTILFTLSAFAQAQLTSNTIGADERTIRELVEKQNRNPDKRIISTTDESIFWTGAFPNPSIAKKPNPENEAINQKIKKERLNYQATSRIERLVVAQSGDIAYEYGNGTLSWDTPDKKHINFDNAYLRTWKKINGEWKVDTFFARPLNTRIAW
jgi:ketosteroid isomerase-like protein